MPYGTAACRELAALTRPGSRTFELGEDFAGLRAPAQLLLGEDRLAVGDDFEDTSGGGNQAERRHISFLGLEDLFRHTDGIGKIPSTCTVFDRHFLELRHRRPPGMFNELILVWRGGTILSSGVLDVPAQASTLKDGERVSGLPVVGKISLTGNALVPRVHASPAKFSESSPIAPVPTAKVAVCRGTPSAGVHSSLAVEGLYYGGTA